MYLESVPRETAWLYAIYENKPMNYFPPIIFFEKKPQTKIKLIFQRESTQFQRKEIYDVTKKRVIMTSKVVWDRYFLLWRIRNTARLIAKLCPWPKYTPLGCDFLISHGYSCYILLISALQTSEPRSIQISRHGQHTCIRTGILLGIWYIVSIFLV